MRIVAALMVLLSSTSFAQAAISTKVDESPAKPARQLLRSREIFDCQTHNARIILIVFIDRTGRPVAYSALRRRC